MAAQCATNCYAWLYSLKRDLDHVHILSIDLFCELAPENTMLTSLFVQSIDFGLNEQTQN